MHNSPINSLINSFASLPGIGPKTAQRLTFHLLAEKKRPIGLKLAETLQQVISQIKQCQRCNNYTEQDICNLCSNPKRTADTLCIVECPADVEAIEQTHTYFGKYFVLHGYLSPLDGLGPAELNLPQLFAQLKASADTKEVIIATNPTMEGKATAHYIASNLKDMHVTCSRIAFGIPLGGEIEYLDANTLTHALQTRLPFAKSMAEN